MNLLACNGNGTTLNIIECVNATNEGGFTGAGWADDSHHFAFHDIERHPFQNLYITKRFVHILNGDDANDRAAIRTIHSTNPLAVPIVL